MSRLAAIWHSPPATLTLEEQTIHLWCATLDQSESCIQEFQQTLSADEQVKAKRFHAERDRHHFIVGRGLLRRLLGQYLDIDPACIQFCYGAHGKPQLAPVHASEITFNLSHSHRLGLYAFTLHSRIGVDLEYIRPISDMAQIVSNFFAEAEKLAFDALSPHQQLLAFFNGWTRKEAYLKAIGDGLAYPLDQIEVSIAPGQPAQLSRLGNDESALAQWWLQSIDISSDYASALVTEIPNPSIQYWHWSFG
jgi:4'-phosphopantetheinyl transferase